MLQVNKGTYINVSKRGTFLANATIQLKAKNQLSIQAVDLVLDMFADGSFILNAPLVLDMNNISYNFQSHKTSRGVNFV